MEMVGATAACCFSLACLRCRLTKECMLEVRRRIASTSASASTSSSSSFGSVLLVKVEELLTREGGRYEALPCLPGCSHILLPVNGEYSDGILLEAALFDDEEPVLADLDGPETGVKAGAETLNDRPHRCLPALLVLLQAGWFEGFELSWLSMADFVLKGGRPLECSSILVLKGRLYTVDTEASLVVETSSYAVKLLFRPRSLESVFASKTTGSEAWVFSRCVQ